MKRIHLIGIGGTGMSAIAIYLLEKGFQVSGSDMNHSLYFDLVRNKGANAIIGHHPELATQRISSFAHPLSAMMTRKSGSAKSRIQYSNALSSCPK